MNRIDIKVVDTWDLTKIYSDFNAFNDDLAKAKDLLDELKTYKNKVTNNIEQLLAFLKNYEKLMRTIEKMYTYAHLAVDVEPNNDDMQTKFAIALGMYQQAESDLVFFELEIIKEKVKILSLLQDEKLKDYVYFLSEIIRSSSHKASDEIEALLSKASAILDVSSQTFDAFRPEFKPVIINGKEHFLNHATYLEFMKNEDVTIRKQAYVNFYQEYKKYSNVFASTLIGNTQKDVFLANARHFDDALEASLFEDDAPKELFYKVLEMANNTYHDYFYEYVALQKKVLKKNKLEIYDLNVPLVKPPKVEYTLDKAFELIEEAVSVLGEDYVKIVRKAREERWIDYYTHKGKRSGAYSSGCYDTAPYILMNYTNDIESVFTLAHELGHSVHSYLSRNNQTYFNSHYRIFVAEVASTVNENLLMNLLFKKAKTDEEKAYLLYRQLDECIGLIYRQPMFAKFEDELHKLVANNEGVSNQVIINLYHELSANYWGEDVNLHDLTKYSCYMVPHFYYNYYVYKYTLGMTVSLAITSRIFNGDTNQIERYLQFLNNGGSKSPIELLKEAGVDPTADKVYQDAYNLFKSILEDFKKLFA